MKTPPSWDAERSPQVRPAAVAGRFYPADATALRATVSEMLAAVPALGGPAPKAVIVPHAGYVYSGPVAASAYARLRPDRALIRRVVMVGPAHRDSFSGLAAPEWEAFATPLGLVPVDRKALACLAWMPQLRVRNQAHVAEHSLETQLPFLQSVLLPGFQIIPLLAGCVSIREVAEVLEQLWGGPETRIVISSDLSHYHESDAARRLDAATAEAIEAGEVDRITEDGACGRVGIGGLLEAARRRGLGMRAVDLRNSGDTAGPRHEVVGYGAFVSGEAARQSAD